MTGNKEQNTAVSGAGKKKIQVRHILMWVFFPVGLIHLLYRHLVHRYKMDIATKTTFIFSAIFAFTFLAYIAFVLIMIGNLVFSGAEINSGTFIVLAIISVALFAAFLALFILLGSFTSRATLKPLRVMIEKIDDISADNLSARLDAVHSNDELSELTVQINDMLDSIENSFQQQKYFVSDASHELRTPISVIHGYAELLGRWGKNDPKIVEEAVDAIYTESNNMKQIVEQLLYITKLGSFEFVPKPVNLTELIEDIISGYNMTHADKEFTTDIDGEISIMADKAMMTELIRVIADNAIKYSPQGGRIHIQCCYENADAVIAITDNGIGISADDLPRIFDRFYRCDKSRGREDGSTGLGLAIAKSIVDMVGGRITCDSEIGVGTTFTIIVPRVAEEPI